MSTEAVRITNQLRGGADATRAARKASFGPEWITKNEACRILHCSMNSFANFKYSGYFDAIEMRPASDTAMSAAGCGLLLKRADIERIAAIRKRCRIGIGSAARVLAAIKTGGPL